MLVALPELLNPFTVPCRACSAVAGQQCRNDVTGGPLRRGLAHHVRIRDAYPDVVDDANEADYR